MGLEQIDSYERFDVLGLDFLILSMMACSFLLAMPGSRLMLFSLLKLDAFIHSFSSLFCLALIFFFSPVRYWVSFRESSLMGSVFMMFPQRFSFVSCFHYFKGLDLSIGFPLTLLWASKLLMSILLYLGSDIFLRNRWRLAAQAGGCLEDSCASLRLWSAMCFLRVRMSLWNLRKTYPLCWGRSWSD